MKTVFISIIVLSIQLTVASRHDSIYASNNAIQPSSRKLDNCSIEKVTNQETMRALAIFAAFNDRPQEALPLWIQDIFNPNVPNSLTHYYTTQSYGQHIITGDAINHWFYADSGYHSGMTKQQFVRSILKQVDNGNRFCTI
ncbi:MAG: hypothetical protein GF353_22385 [Candidatus Lokiarchaeota archaeon]|nr:hypothetical protein [Candidatus Lokiarchaeota archaeon]